MPDFTNLDSALVASYWIYFVGSFIAGAVIGALAARLFFHRKEELMEQENKAYRERLEKLEETERRLEEKKDELERLKKELSGNELYWNAKKYGKQENPGDKMLYDSLIQKGNHS